MKFIEVTQKDLEKRKTNDRKKIHEIFEAFLKTNFSIAKVDFGNEHYVSSLSAYSSFRHSLTRHKKAYPIRVELHENNVYFIRTDVEKANKQ